MNDDAPPGLDPGGAPSLPWRPDRGTR